MLVLLVIGAMITLRVHGQPPPGEEPGKEATSPATRGPVEARLNDDSVMKITLKEERVEVHTPYGILRIPAADLQRIDFGRRIAPELSRRIDAAVINLGSSQFPVREAAVIELQAVGEKAYPALLKALKHSDMEVNRRAKELVDRLRETTSEERLEVPDHDIVLAGGMKIIGRVSADAFRVQTLAFGEQRLKVADLRSLHIPGAGEAEPRDVLPDPGTLSGYQNQVGKSVYFRITGGMPGAPAPAPPGVLVFPLGGGGGGTVWGTDVYTLDSALALTAVHAGALKTGQTGVVKVTIMGPQANYTGSTRHGITSQPYGTYPGSYKVSKP
jgi:hypothetical protein